LSVYTLLRSVGLKASAARTKQHKTYDDADARAFAEELLESGDPTTTLVKTLARLGVTVDN